MKAWLKHAFAIDTGDAVPTEEQSQILNRLAEEVVRRRLTTPAIAFLEMSRPLNFLGSQTLHFFAPMISAVTDSQSHQHLAKFLEQRGAIDVLCDRITEKQKLLDERLKNDGEPNPGAADSP